MAASASAPVWVQNERNPKMAVMCQMDALLLVLRRLTCADTPRRLPRSSMEAGKAVDADLVIVSVPFCRRWTVQSRTFLPSSKRPFGVMSMISGADIGYVGGSRIRRWYRPG